MESDVFQMAFSTWYGYFEFLVMPFGLTNTPTAFIDLMNRVFPLPWSVCDYLHRWYFGVLKEYGRARLSSQNYSVTLRERQLYATFLKCEFWLNEVIFFGHVVYGNGIFVDPKKVKAIVNWERPMNVIEIQNFLV